MDTKRNEIPSYIKEYQQVRALHQEIMIQMAEYANKHSKEINLHLTKHISTMIQQGKLSPNINLDLDFQNQTDVQVYGDLTTYDHVPERSICQIFLDSNQYSNKEKIEFVQAMLNSKLGLFEYVEEVQFGIHRIKNVLSGKTIEIVDQSLSLNGDKPEGYLFDRIIEYNGIHFICGIHIFLSKKDPEVRKYIKRNKGKYRPTAQLLEAFTISKLK